MTRRVSMSRQAYRRQYGLRECLDVSRCGGGRSGLVVCWTIQLVGVEGRVRGLKLTNPCTGLLYLLYESLRSQCAALMRSENARFALQDVYQLASFSLSLSESGITSHSLFSSLEGWRRDLCARTK